MNEETMETAIENNGKTASSGKTKSGAHGTLRMIPFGDILCRKEVNARTDTDKKSLTELAKSIAANGLIEPLVVYKTKAGFEVGAGFRRYAALVKNETKRSEEIPCVVRDAAGAPMDNLIENVQREELSKIDLCEALRKRVDGTYVPIGDETPRQWARKELAERLSLTAATVESYVRAATNLTKEVKAIAREHDAPARMLVAWAAQPEDKQIEAAKEWQKEAKKREAEGVQRRRTKRSSSKEDGTQRPSKALLEGEKSILQFKLEHAKGAEREIILRQIDTLRYVVGELERMPGLVEADRRAYARFYREQAEAAESEEDED